MISFLIVDDSMLTEMAQSRNQRGEEKTRTGRKGKHS